MFSKLFGVRARPQSPPRPPAGSRVYAIGDIHGRLDLLRRLHELILEDVAAAPAGRRVAVYLGDYVDRGEASRQVIELLLSRPLPGFEAVHLSGNHEDMMLTFLDDAAMGPMWMFNGGDATLLSYGIGHDDGATPEQRQRNIQEALAKALPVAHLAFLRGLKSYHVEGDYLFVHAGIVPGRPLEEQQGADLMWIREEFLTSEADHGHCVVHGHTIVPEPEVRDNRIAIDTGAYFSNKLSCLVLDGEERRFLQT